MTLSCGGAACGLVHVAKSERCSCKGRDEDFGYGPKL